MPRREPKAPAGAMSSPSGSGPSHPLTATHFVMQAVGRAATMPLLGPVAPRVHWPRIAHSVAFALMAIVCTKHMPAPGAALTAYSAVRAATGMTPAAHGPHCRLWTVCSVTSIVAALCGPWWSVAAAACLCACPRAWLWWPPKGSTKVKTSCSAQVAMKKRAAGFVYFVMLSQFNAKEVPTFSVETLK